MSCWHFPEDRDFLRLSVRIGMVRPVKPADDGGVLKERCTTAGGRKASLRPALC